MHKRTFSELFLCGELSRQLYEIVSTTSAVAAAASLNAHSKEFSGSTILEKARFLGPKQDVLQAWQGGRKDAADAHPANDFRRFAFEASRVASTRARIRRQRTQ